MEEKPTAAAKEISSLEIDGEFFKFKVNKQQDTAALKKAAKLISKIILQLRENYSEENYHRILLLTCLHLCDEEALSKLLNKKNEEACEKYLERVEKKVKETIDVIALAKFSKDDNL